MYRRLLHGGIALAGLSAIPSGVGGSLSDAVDADIDPTITLSVMFDSNATWQQVLNLRQLEFLVENRTSL